MRKWFESIGKDRDETAQSFGAPDRIFTPKYTRLAWERSEAKETRAREDHIKNLPVGRWRF